MPVVRTVILALFASFMLAVPGSAAGAGEPGWKLLQVVGEVTVGGEGVKPVAVRRDDFVPVDGWVQTGKTGRAVLVRSGDTVVVAPNSRVRMPSERVNGNTQVLQSLGSVFYSISKQKAPHFQVDTPYMAAVVKGTSFVITVAADRSRIDVKEGLVEVSNPGRRDVEFVRPGFSASVAHRVAGVEAPGVEISATRGLPPVPMPTDGLSDRGGEVLPEAGLEHSATEAVVQPEPAASEGSNSSSAPDANDAVRPILVVAAVAAQEPDGSVYDPNQRPRVMDASGSGGTINVAIGDSRLNIASVSDGLAVGADGDEGRSGDGARDASVFEADGVTREPTVVQSSGDDDSGKDRRRGGDAGGDRGGKGSGGGGDGTRGGSGGGDRGGGDRGGGDRGGGDRDGGSGGDRNGGKGGGKGGDGDDSDGGKGRGG